MSISSLHLRSRPTRGLRMSLFAAKYAPAKQERQGRGVASTYGGGVGGWQASGRSGCLQGCGFSVSGNSLPFVPHSPPSSPVLVQPHLTFTPGVSPGQTPSLQPVWPQGHCVRFRPQSVAASCSTEIGAPASRESGDIGSQQARHSGLRAPESQGLCFSLSSLAGVAQDAPYL